MLQFDAANAIDRESFEVGQLDACSSADAAIRQMAVRFAKEDNALADAVREQQEKQAALFAMQEALLGVLGVDDERGAVAIRSKIAALETRLSELSKYISKEFPSYYNAAAHPKPLTVEEAQLCR